MTNGKKKRKTIEWERLEISLKNWSYQVRISYKDSTIKDRNCKDLTEAEEARTQKNCTKHLLMTQITMIMWSLT